MATPIWVVDKSYLSYLRFNDLSFGMECRSRFLLVSSFTCAGRSYGILTKCIIK